MARAAETMNNVSMLTFPLLLLLTTPDFSMIPQVAPTNMAFGVSLTADGRFAATVGHGEVRVFATDGALLRSLRTQWGAGRLALSPDARSILLYGEFGNDPVVLMRANGTNATTLLPSGSGSFLEDGRILTWSRALPSAQFRLYNAAGTDPRVLPLPPDLDPSALVRVIGERVYFSGTLNKARGVDVVLTSVRLDGSDLVTHKRWSPQNEIVALDVAPDATAAFVLIYPGKGLVIERVSLTAKGGPRVSIRAPEVRSNGRPYLAVSSSGARVFFGDQDGMVHIYDAVHLKQQRVQPTSEVEIAGMARSKSNVASLSIDGGLTLFSDDGDVLRHFAGNGNDGSAVPKPPSERASWSFNRPTFAPDSRSFAMLDLRDRVAHFHLDGRLIRTYASAGEGTGGTVFLSRSNRPHYIGNDGVFQGNADGSWRRILETPTSAALLGANDRIVERDETNTKIRDLEGKEVARYPSDPGVPKFWAQNRRAPPGESEHAGRFAQSGAPSFGGANEICKTLAVSPDHERILCSLSDPHQTKFLGIRLFDKNASLLAADGIGGNIYSADMGNDGDPVVVSETIKLPDGRDVSRIQVWRLKDGTYVRDPRPIPQPDSVFADVALSPNKRWLLVTAGAVARLHNLENGESLRVALVGDQWLVYTDDGYFDGSQGAARAVVMVRDDHWFGVDQFALRLNRPDLIYRRMQFDSGSGAVLAPDTLEYFRRRYLSRIAKAGLSERDLGSELHVPTARLTETTLAGPRTLTLTAEFADEKFKLQRYNVYVNDVALFGAEGKAIDGQTASIKESVELSGGTNQVEVSVVNERGAESLRAHHTVNAPRGAEGRLWILGLGVSAYRGAGVDPLEFAAKDAEDFVESLSKARGYSSVERLVLTDDRVSVSALDEVATWIAKSGVDDTVAIAIAGHGLHDRSSSDLVYYFLPPAAEIDRLSSTAIPFAKLESLLYSTKARRKLLFMDTCESGEAEDMTAASAIAANAKTTLSARGIKAVAKQVQPLSPTLLERDRLIDADLARRSGAVIFSSSRGGERSYESGAIKNGFFTHAVLRGLAGDADRDRNGLIDTFELRRFIHADVVARTGGLQHPTVDRDNPRQVITLPVVGSKKR